MSLAEMEPTLPKPWTAQVDLKGFSPILSMALRAATMTPRPVASTRPLEPPMTRGFPVTTEGEE